MDAWEEFKVEMGELKRLLDKHFCGQHTEFKQDLFKDGVLYCETCFITAQNNSEFQGVAPEDKGGL